MQKPFLLLSLVLGAMSLHAQTFTEFPAKEDIISTGGGPQVLGMSSNGRYISGITYTAGAFVYDVAENNFISTGGTIVSNDGTIVEGLTKRNLHTGERERLDGVDSSYKFAMTTGISGDGKIVTGTGGPDWTRLNPIYWEGSTIHYLPYPSTEEVGTFKVNGCRAEGTNDDGSVIWGYFIANPNTYPLIIWERQSDGSYDYTIHKNIWEELYEPQYGYVYDYDSATYDFVTGDNPYCRFQPYAISGDGRLVLIRTQENTGEVSPPVKVGVYHVDTKEFVLQPWSEDDVIGRLRDFDSRGIANDGTIVGFAFEADLHSATPFIMFPGKGAEYLNDVFPQFDRLFFYEDNSLLGYPYLLNVISEDARYIAGYSTEYYTYEGEDGPSYQDLCFWGYVIDMKPEGSEPVTPDDPEKDAVEAIDADLQGDPVYYTVDGLRVQNPSHGIYIEKLPSGKIRKVAF